MNERNQSKPDLQHSRTAKTRELSLVELAAVCGGVDGGITAMDDWEAPCVFKLTPDKHEAASENIKP